MTELKTYDSFESLSDRIYTPSFQRNINREVVNNIKKYIYERQELNLHLCIGVLDLCKFGSQLFVMNGQHRLKALEEYYKETNKDVKFHAIIYTVYDSNEMESIFKLLNSGLAVPDYIISPPEGKKELLSKIELWLRELPLTRIASGTKVIRPNIDLTKFMNYLTDSEWLIQTNTFEEFKIIFWKINHKIRKNKNHDSWKKKLGVTDNMLNKIADLCQNYEGDKIFIGLYKDYSALDQLL